MARIDLDDLPPRIAKALAALANGEEVLLVRDGAVVARLTAQVADPAPIGAATPSEVEMEEILEHFQSIIEEEF